MTFIEEVRKAMIELPEIKAQRGGITYETSDHSRYELNRRIIKRLIASQSQIVEGACIVALANGWDLHVHYPKEPLSVTGAKDHEIARLKHVGIEFRPARYVIPTLTERRNSDLDEFDWDD